MCRHAKSDWGNFELKDYDRPLNKRGLNDAPDMGKRLFDQNYAVDGILSSTAKRAEQTAKLVAEGLQHKQEIIWERSLYHASASTIASSIYALDNQLKSIIVVCHNPGITTFVNSLSSFSIDNVVTCGITAFEFETELWEDIAKAKCKFLFHDFPKSVV